MVDGYGVAYVTLLLVPVVNSSGTGASSCGTVVVTFLAGGEVSYCGDVTVIWWWHF